MPWKRMISTVSMTLIVGLTAACGTTLRVAQIPLRDELRQCLALEAIQREDLPPVASAESLRAALDALGIAPAPAIERAALAYTRQVQIEERAIMVRRDLAQTQVGREMCNRTGELVSLIEANNAGPQE